jgi:hypothetical protein
MVANVFKSMPLEAIRHQGPEVPKGSPKVRVRERKDQKMFKRSQFPQKGFGPQAQTPKMHIGTGICILKNACHILYVELASVATHMLERIYPTLCNMEGTIIKLL